MLGAPSLYPMPKDMKLKWIIVDSLMFRQLKYAPFLRSAAKKYQADFIPPLGYEEDGLSFFSGKKPDQINIGPLFCYSPDTSIFKWLKPLRHFRFLDFTFLKYGLLVLSHFLKKEKHLGKSDIPIKLIANFDISSHSLPSNDYVLEVRTVLDNLLEKDKSFAFIKGPWLITDKQENFRRNFFRNIFCRGDEATIRLAEQYNNKDLAIIWLLELDSIAHKFGPDSREAINQIKKTDKLLENYLRGENFIIHSDHGMAQVRNTVNLLKVLKKIPVKIGKDYLFFSDSAMVRFWLFNPVVWSVIKEKLESLSVGHFLTSEEKDKYGYNFPDNRYGDEFFVLDEGNIILPSYMSKRIVKGMHGYLPQGEQKGVFLSNLDLPRKDKIFYDEILTLISPFI